MHHWHYKNSFFGLFNKCKILFVQLFEFTRCIKISQNCWSRVAKVLANPSTHQFLLRTAKIWKVAIGKISAGNFIYKSKQKLYQLNHNFIISHANVCMFYNFFFSFFFLEILKSAVAPVNLIVCNEWLHLLIPFATAKLYKYIQEWLLFCTE